MCVNTLDLNIMDDTTVRLNVCRLLTKINVLHKILTKLLFSLLFFNVQETQLRVDPFISRYKSLNAFATFSIHT